MKYMKNGCISILKPLTATTSLFNPLINLGLRSFPDMTPYSNKAPNYLLASFQSRRKWPTNPITNSYHLKHQIDILFQKKGNVAFEPL